METETRNHAEINADIKNKRLEIKGLEATIKDNQAHIDTRKDAIKGLEAELKKDAK